MERKTTRLTYPYLVDPLALNQLGGNQLFEITQPEKVIIGHSEFTASEPLRVGEKAYLMARSTYVELEYLSDRQAFIQWREQQQQAQELARQQAEQKRKTIQIEQANRFYQALAVPFRFTVEIKEVLSGLSERSSGNGMKRNTVTHIFLQEDFASGRFVRKRHQFLCSDSSSRWGGNWSDSLGKGSFQLTENLQPIPTCKQCLKRLEQFRTKRTD